MSANDKRRALGKGLDSLLGPKPTATKVPEPAAPVTVEAIPSEIAVDHIDPSRFQTRTVFNEDELRELSSSIAATGVVQPVVVRKAKDGRYELIAGERRWRASKLAGKATIPAVVREVNDEQAMEMTIVENLQRTDLNPMEQARAFDRLSREFKLTQEQMASRTGKDRASIGNFLRLLKLPEPIQVKVERGELSFGHARTLLALETPEAIQSAAQKVMALSMNVRQTETYVKGLLDPEKKIGKSDKVEEPPMDPNVREAQTEIQRRLGLKVKIEDRNGKGRVIIEYARLEDFDSLYETLTK